MRIEDKARIGYENLVKAEQKKEVEKERVKTEIRQRERDKVEVSSSKSVDNLKAKVKEASDVREERVAELKKQIENGTYNISGQKVAEKIINLAIDDLF